VAPNPPAQTMRPEPSHCVIPFPLTCRLLLFLLHIIAQSLLLVLLYAILIIEVSPSSSTASCRTTRSRCQSSAEQHLALSWNTKSSVLAELKHLSLMDRRFAICLTGTRGSSSCGWQDFSLFLPRRPLESNLTPLEVRKWDRSMRKGETGPDEVGSTYR
jgi:hypothetical protein